jgi:hypothetical protein
MSYRGYFYTLEYSDGISERRCFRSDVNAEIIDGCALFDEITTTFRTELGTVDQIIFAL